MVELSLNDILCLLESVFILVGHDVFSEFAIEGTQLLILNLQHLYLFLEVIDVTFLNHHRLTGSVSLILILKTFGGLLFFDDEKRSGLFTRKNY